MTSYVWKLFIIHITSTILPCLTLPRNIRIAAILDREGDEKHELAFTAAIDDINNRNNWILDGIEIEPEVIKIPYGDRYIFILFKKSPNIKITNIHCIMLIIFGFKIPFLI